MSLIPWPLSVPVLSDGHVTLRAHHTRDIEPMVEMVTDPQTQSWTTVPADYHVRAAEAFLMDVVSPGWETGTTRIWVVEVDGGFVGQVELRGDGPVKEIAYVTHPFARNKGTTRAAVRLVLDYAFTELQTEVVSWQAFVGNVPSMKVAYSCGFTLHDTIPRHLYERGNLRDAWTGSIAFGEPTYPRQEWTENHLVGERVRLRPLREPDFQAWDETLADEAAQSYLVAPAGAFTADSAAARFAKIQWDAARGRACTWVITEADSDEFCGLIVAHGLNDQHRGASELEWMLHPNARGKGLMGDAVRLAIAHVLSPEGFNQRRLTAFVAASNTASNNVAVKAGGRLFGTQTTSEPIGADTFDDLNEYEWLR